MQVRADEGHEESNEAPIRLLVADDERAVVLVLDALISLQDDIELVGTASDAEGAIALALKEHPDVAILDVRMPGGGGLRAAREISRRCPNTRVIALSAHEDEATIISMMGAGADAYVPKGGSTDLILRKIYEGAERALRSKPADDAWGGPTPGLERPPAARHLEQRERILDVLQNDALSAAFRPIFDVRTGAIVGVESVPRIPRLPVRGSDAWFAEADAVGLLLELELAAIRASLRGLGDIPGDAFLAIGVSPSTVVRPELEQVLAEAPGGRIVLGITEHAQVDDYDELREALGSLRASGVRIVVTDVGAGIASLHHLMRLDPDFMKIDSSLTHAIDSDPSRHAVVAALASCAKQLDAKVVAEGVSSLDQLEELTSLGVDYFQGFLLAEPGSLSEITWNAVFRSHPFRVDNSGRNGSI